MNNKEGGEERSMWDEGRREIRGIT